MKRQVLLSIASFFIAAFVNAQIPNASFEDWSSGEPVGWFTGNSPGFNFVTQSTTAHDGSKAAQCNVIDILGNSFSAPFALGEDGMGAHTATAPEAIHGWYIFNSVDSDIAVSSAGMYDNTAPTGSGFAPFTPTATYKEFVINMYYNNGEPEGDSLLLFFIISNPNSELPHSGTYLTLDHIYFGALSAVTEVTDHETAIETISPNPSGSVAEIIYNIASPTSTTISLYDMNGRMMKTLVNEKQFPGRYKAVADLSSLSAGTYLCRLMTDSYSEVRKVQVVR